MRDYKVIEYLSVNNTNEKTAYVLEMLQRYIRSLRSPAWIESIKIEEFELSDGSNTLSLDEASYDNCEPREEKYSFGQDDFFIPFIAAFEDESGYKLNLPNAQITVNKDESDIITLRATYTCFANWGAQVGYYYWLNFLSAFDCKELREALTYKCLVLKESAGCSDYIIWNEEFYNGMVGFVYNEDGINFVQPTEWSGNIDHCNKWYMNNFNFDDYEDYTWLANVEEWSQMALDTFKDRFASLGIGIDRYFAPPDEEDSEYKYMYQGIYFFTKELKDENVKEFISLFDSFVKYLRNLVDKGVEIYGNSLRYIVGDNKDYFCVINVDDSELDNDGIIIRYMKI